MYEIAVQVNDPPANHLLRLSRSSWFTSGPESPSVMVICMTQFSGCRRFEPCTAYQDWKAFPVGELLKESGCQHTRSTDTLIVSISESGFNASECSCGNLAPAGAVDLHCNTRNTRSNVTFSTLRYRRTIIFLSSSSVSMAAFSSAYRP